MSELFEKTISSSEKFRGRIFATLLDEIELPDGKRSTREVVQHNGGVCVAAFNDEDCIAFVRQFRYPYKQVLLELPAGKLEPHEDPDDAIQRELREEVGCFGENWRSLGCMYPSPGYVSEIIYLFTCRCGEFVGQDFDEDENLEVEYISLDKAVEMVFSGEIVDAKTQIILLRLYAERTKSVVKSNI